MHNIRRSNVCYNNKFTAHVQCKDNSNFKFFRMFVYSEVIFYFIFYLQIFLKTFFVGTNFYIILAKVDICCIKLLLKLFFD